MTVVVMEYPGYSYYRDRKSNEATLIEDANNLISFLEIVLGVYKEDIILYGRSMGTGICCELASQENSFFGSVVKIFL